MDTASQVAETLGGHSVLKKRVRTWVELEELVRAGLPKRSLQLVARRLVEAGRSTSSLVYEIVPPATFKRRTRLSLQESERTERLARLVVFVEAVWHSPAEARSFINRPHPLLGQQTPLVVARTELGARRVERLLHDVEHGLAV